MVGTSILGSWNSHWYVFWVSRSRYQHLPLHQNEENNHQLGWDWISGHGSPTPWRDGKRVAYWMFLVENHILQDHHTKSSSARLSSSLWKFIKIHADPDCRLYLEPRNWSRLGITFWWTNIAMERSTIFNGKIHYFYGHVQLRTVRSPGRVSPNCGRWKSNIQHLDLRSAWLGVET